MIDCKKYADEILDSITGYGHLAVISIGDDPASQSYIRGKKKDCERVGFGFTHCAFKDGAIQDEIADCIRSLNENPEITGIILQLPVPESYEAEYLASIIYPSKDVDGLHPLSPFSPCTPEGIRYLLHRELGVYLIGKHAVIIGRGKLVGKPLAKMLLAEDMTVTVCHSKTPLADVQQLASLADVVVVAAGVPQHFAFPNLQRRAVVIDCGVHRLIGGDLCGDVSYTSNGHCTPVPGGIGLLTRAMLMKHVERKTE